MKVTPIILAIFYLIMFSAFLSIFCLESGLTIPDSWMNELFWVGSHLKWISNDSVYRSNRIRVSFVHSYFDWMCWIQLIGLFTNCPSKPSLQIHPIFYCGDDEERLYEDEHLQLVNDCLISGKHLDIFDQNCLKSPWPCYFYTPKARPFYWVVLGLNIKTINSSD